jgi:hypothetical protein
MNIIEHFTDIDPNASPQVSAGYKLANVALKWLGVGTTVLIAGTTAAALGSREGFDVAIAGFAVDYAGSIALAKGLYNIIWDGDNEQQ